jgi:hypothetical protein
VVCQKFKEGGLSVLDPEQALTALLVKWIIQAYKPGNVNVQLFMRYKLLKAQPFPGSKWAPDSCWALQPGYTLKTGSKVWNRIGKVWKIMVKEVSLCDPVDFYSTLNRGLWLGGCFHLIGPNLSRARAA